jgi:hypothetical protein
MGAGEQGRISNAQFPIPNTAINNTAINNEQLAISH